MDIVYVIIALFLAIVVSDILNKIFPKIQVIFFQIIIGILVSYLPFFREFNFDPELFMLIIIKPLIFGEAQKISLDELKKYLEPIFSLSVPLVVCTVIITGTLIKFIFPGVPGFAAFLLTAIVIPTNAGIVKSIVDRLEFPEDVMAVLEGESLFNDSIAILMFELALAANLTNTFHLGKNIYKFIFAVVGGIVVGIILGFIIIKIRYWITKNDFENESMMVIIQVITPFVVYIIAEKYLHVSGILAVIIAGILHRMEKPILNMKSTKLQVISDSTWNILIYVLDGTIAIFLGISIPDVIRTIIIYDFNELIYLILLSIVVYVIVAVLRFLWVTFQHDKFSEEKGINKFKTGIIYALGGIHGTITLVIALSIPVINNSGNPFLFREELIFISATVILISIVVPTIVFPLIIRKKDSDTGKYAINEIRKEMIHYTIDEMKKNSAYKNTYSLNIVIKMLKDQLSFFDPNYFKSGDREEIENILDKTTEIEIQAIDELVRENKISKNKGLFYKMYIVHANKKDFISWFIKVRLWLLKRRLSKIISKGDKKRIKSKFGDELHFVQEYSCEKVLAYLHESLNKENYANVSFVIHIYEKKIENTMDDNDKDVKDYLAEVFQIQHTFIQDNLEKGRISHEIASELRERISYDEMIYYKES